MNTRDGYVHIEYIGGQGLNLALSEYDTVLTVWKEGQQRFYEAHDPWGGLVTFRVDEIRYVSRRDATSLERVREEDKLDKIEGIA